MSKKLTFQEIILTLQQYWNDQGCMLMQAYDNEKGAGTMSPYTFLRAIGRNHGMRLMLSHLVVQQTVATGKTQIVSTNTTNSKWS